MSKIDSNMSGYLHTYEAYRVPKRTKVKDASGKEKVLMIIWNSQKSIIL